MARWENEARAAMRAFAALEPRHQRRLARRLPAGLFRAVDEAWFWQAHGGQNPPKGDWLTWLMMAGRGFGKTIAGAQWLWARVREVPEARIALVGANLGEVARVMVTGPTGLIAAAGSGGRPRWVKSERILTFPSGALAFAYSAHDPDGLRGPQHHFAWCDELAKWPRGEATWDNLMLGLRLGERPRALVTTTPRPVPLLRRIRGLERMAETKGRMTDNVHLPDAHVAAARKAYGGTRLGRQELDGELIEDVAGSLWPRALIEACRIAPFMAGTVTFPHGGHLSGEGLGKSHCPLRRVVVGVDPPASAEGVCGISVCALAEDESFYVLADASVAAASPEGWARAVAQAARAWSADRVVAEVNNGGDMVEAVLRNVERTLPVKSVHASRGKAARAEPVAALFETKQAKFAGRFPELEDELAGMTNAGGYEGPGGSPDRADAMVWAMTELMAAMRRREPRIRTL